MNTTLVSWQLWEVTAMFKLNSKSDRYHYYGPSLLDSLHSLTISFMKDYD